MFYGLIFLGGLIIGSFLNVVILRGPGWWGLTPSAHTDYSQPSGSRSQCASCRRTLKSWHLIPLLSWLILRARCAFCGQTISMRYPLVELAGGMAAIIAALAWGLTPAALVVFAAACLLIALGLIDLDTGYLPDALTLPLIGLGLLVNAFGLIVPWHQAVIGAGVGYGVFWLIRFAYLRARGLEGLGLGDAKMLAGLGALLGWAALPFIVLIAAIGGLAMVGIMALRGRSVDGQTAIRFGPFLALGGLIMLYAAGFLGGWLPL